MESQPIRTVLIGTSLKGASDSVVRTGIELARLHGATAHLVHAYDRSPRYGGATPEERGCDAGWVAACRALEMQATRVGLDGDASCQHVRLGAPHQVLQDLARDLDADLVVLGHSHGFPLGPTTDRAVRRLCCPVLVVHETARVPPARILAAVDLSPASVQVLCRGLAILGPQTAAPPSVELLHVLPPVGGRRETPPCERRSESLARQSLHVCSLGAGAGRGMGERVVTGDPDQEIVAEAVAWRADVVLVGTHARTRLDRFLLGSVAQDVLRWAPCAVLIVPPGAVMGLEMGAAEPIAQAAAV